MPTINLLIKPASGMCNMHCKYCFYHDLSEKQGKKSFEFMSEATMENIIKKTIAYSDHSCTIAFQGGEPTLRGLPFFKHTVDLVNKYNTKKLKIHYALQTNGYQLNEEWADFFARNNFLVGVSVDGTIHTHNAYRKNTAGEDTFLDILKTINYFNQHHVEYNILSVVNRRTALSVRKIYNYYKKMGFKFLQFIPCLDPLNEVSGEKDYSLTPLLYGSFLCELFDLWYDDLIAGNYISIRQFDNYISILLTGKAEACDMNGFCSIQNVIEANGDVYPCDFFVLDEYKLGNLNSTDFTEIHRKRLESGFLSQDKLPSEACQKCSYFPICRGGCYRHRIMSHSPRLTNYFCPAYKIFFNHALPRLKSASRMFQMSH